MGHPRFGTAMLARRAKFNDTIVPKAGFRSSNEGAAFG
jgi:hypothetical protein